MFRINNSFARRELALSDAEFAILGIPYDSSSSFISGSRNAPLAIRHASLEIEDYDIEENIDFLDLKIADVGDVEVAFGSFDETGKRAESEIRDILKKNKNIKPVILGGEHTVAYFAASAVKEVHGSFIFLVFDAHLDYRQSYNENPFSHACTCRRISELIGAENIVAVGIRSASKEELSEAEKSGVKIIKAVDFLSNKEKVKKEIAEKVEGKKLHISLDFDFFDLSNVSEVSNPEPGGLTYRDYLEILNAIPSFNAICFDFTELCPKSFFSSSSAFAAKTILKTLGIAKKKQK